MSVSAIVLAAGKGTRMKSDLPKPLHRARGRSLLSWVIHALKGADLDAISVVVGHGRELVVEELECEFERSFLFAEQLTQRGTGDAAAVGLGELDLFDNSFSEDDHVLVVPGDAPLLSPSTVHAVVAAHLASKAAATVVSAIVDDPTGYGRVVRAADGSVEAIVEHRDATDEQRAIAEINSSMYCFRRSLLGPALRMISTDNAQGELYLTDTISVLVEAGHSVAPFVVDAIEVSGVNDREQLGAAAEHLGHQIIAGHMRAGVTIVQPSSTVIDAEVSIEPDVTVQPSTVIEGASMIASGAVVGPHTHLADAAVGANAVVVASTVRDASVGSGEHVGPYVHLDGGSTS